MKLIKAAKIGIVILVIYFVIYNTYFGWNQKPINGQEALCDKIFSKGIFLMVCLYIPPLYNAYENFIDKNEK